MSSSELLDAVPYWTEKMYPPGGGQDHLGLGSVVTDRVLPRLSPGINVLTIHPRYWSFYAFVLSEFWSRDLPRTKAALKAWYRPLECIYSVACSLCDGPDHRGTPIGTRRINSVVAREPDGFNLRFHYMDSPMGGYGLYYATVMQAVGLVALADRRLGLTVDAVTPAGQRVADAFRSVVADTEYYRHWIDRHGEPVPHAAAVEWETRKSPGYFAALSIGEQEAALDILDRHHSEAVLLCSLFQAHAYARHQEEDTAPVEVRDAWRTMLLHPLWQPTRPAVDDSATLLRHWCRTEHDLIERLDSLASYVSDGEPLAIVGGALGCRPEHVAITSGRVNRGSLGSQHVPIYIVEDPDASLTPDSASRALASLAALHPEIEYLRLEDRSHDIIAFADYRHENFLHVNRTTDDDQALDPPAIETPPWRAALQTLYEMVGDEVAAA